MKNFWNELYVQDEFVYGENPNEYLKEKLEEIKVGKILFPCEGEGRNAVFASQLDWNVFAFDHSTVGKKKGEALAKKKGVYIDYKVSSVEEISYLQQSFDVLALVYAHFYSDKRRAYHKKLSSFLKKGGTLILEAFSNAHTENQIQNSNAGGPKDVEMLYDLEEIKADFEGFEFVEAKENIVELNEGKYHVGKASVIRILAIKK